MARDHPHEYPFVYSPSQEDVERSNVYQFMQSVGVDSYDDLVGRSQADPEWFWDAVIEPLGVEFSTPYSRVRDDTAGPAFTRWYVDGQLNIAANVLDRHGGTAAEDPGTVACIWEAEDGTVEEVSFGELHKQANQVANALTALGVHPGDRVGIYMPMVPAVIASLYGCFKCGAIAVPIFSGFGVDATAARLEDAGCEVVIGGDGAYRRGSVIPLAETLTAAIDQAGCVEELIVYEHVGAELPPMSASVHRWEAVVGGAQMAFATLELPADHPSMLLYSSGTTGDPKGIVHTHAGALIQPGKEIYFNFDHQPDDVFFWVSDIGWMMGPWMLIGNHLFGGTIVMYEGAPDHPTAGRLLEVVDRHHVTVFGISPTAIRALRQEGDDWVRRSDLSSLRILGSTGEPWDVESWMWFFEEVGGGELPIMNISGGTEIMGCFLMPSPLSRLRPTTLGGPGLGMAVEVVDTDGSPLDQPLQRGYLVASDSCPSMTQSLWSGDERYLDEYWSTWDGLWDHGDWAMVDPDGLWYLQGRADEALNIAGRKVGPAEIEGVLMDHAAVNQAAVVGVDDPTTGTAAVAFVIPEAGVEPDESLTAALGQRVRERHGPPFRPREILYVDAFPKTQSGKILRRVMADLYDGASVGELDTLQNPAALEAIRDVC